VILFVTSCVKDDVSLSLIVGGSIQHETMYLHPKGLHSCTREGSKRLTAVQREIGGWKGREAEPGGMKEVAAGEGMSLIHNSLCI